MKSHIQTMVRQLAAGLLERDEPLRLALLSALAGEHLLLLGQPGTAKSEMARRLHLAFSDGGYFERLLTKFSVPEELFGPLSIKALEEDRYLRLTERYLPSASIAFIDEIFKANSAILNALLTLLNEREFDNGDARLKVPLISVIAASNELPEDDSLLALYDRFLCRYQVQAVSDAQFVALLQLTETKAQLDAGLRFSRDEIARIQADAVTVTLPEQVLTLLQELRQFLQQNGLQVSDRRWRKAVKLLKVAAFTDDRRQVSIWDCGLLQHCLWSEPEQREMLFAWYCRYVGTGSQLGLPALDKLVATWEAALQRDSHSQVQRLDHQGRPVFIAADGRTTLQPVTHNAVMRDGQLLYLAPPGTEERSNDGTGYSKQELAQRFFDRLYQQTHLDGQWVHLDQYVANPANRFIERIENAPCMEPLKHSSAFIAARLAETGRLTVELTALRDSVQNQVDSLAATLRDPLWLPAEFAQTAAAGLQQALRHVTQLLARLQAVADGYAGLPQLG
ncbi:AAA family ATPase [Methylomonas rhizoryzae]|uniref:AAA family ATPase n=1 Tax=Methylomonas rhizoryzae TaxID=2608981 RepID=UPI001232B852|nr:AAA family ATPase [Methylomonas rhizoryzae]